MYLITSLLFLKGKWNEIRKRGSLSAVSLTSCSLKKNIALLNSCLGQQDKLLAIHWLEM